MESLLATVFFAVPLITWLSGLILLTDSQWKLARPSHAPRGFFSTSRKSYSPEIAPGPVFESVRPAVDEVSL
jgi:hypothetical protein